MEQTKQKPVIIKQINKTQKHNRQNLQINTNLMKIRISTNPYFNNNLFNVIDNLRWIAFN